MQILQDLRFALRQLRKAPIFTLVAVVTLALGIGANTAIFTLLDQALLRSLPVSHPEQLVRLQFTGSTRGHFNSFGGDDHDYFSYPMYRDLRDQNSVFESLIASDQQNVSVQWNNKPDLVGCELASGNYFQALGLQPALGRLFLPADDVPNSSPVVVLSFNYWKRQFGSDPSVINQTLLINAHPFTIVGVAPPGFHSIVAGLTEEVFVPLTTKNIITPRWQDLDDFNSHWMMIVGRLKPGVSRAQAEASLQPLWHACGPPSWPRFPMPPNGLRRTYLDESHTARARQRARVLAVARPDRHAVLIVMGMVGPAADDGLRERVKPAAGAGCRARARDVGALRHGRGTLADHPPAASRRHAARPDGWGAGTDGCARRLFAAAFARSSASTATDLPFSSSLDTRILLFTFALALVSACCSVWRPLCAFCVPTWPIHLSSRARPPPADQLRFRRAIGCGANRSQPDAAGRRRSVRPHAAQSALASMSALPPTIW